MAEVKISELTTDTPATDDELALYDTSGSDTNKATIADVLNISHTITSTWDFEGDLTFGQSVDDYTWIDGEHPSNQSALGLQCQTANENAAVQLFTKNTDAQDAVTLEIYKETDTLGGLATDKGYLSVGFNGSQYQIQENVAGAAGAVGIRIETEGYPNQLKLTTGGGIGINRGGSPITDEIQIEPHTSGDVTIRAFPDDGNTLHIESQNNSAYQKLLLEGSEVELKSTSGTTTLTGDFQFSDDEQAQFGTAPDYWFVYDSANTQLELNSTDIDGGGTDGLIFTVADGGQVVDFPGDVSFSGLTGTPNFSNHDHSEGGLATVPNAGLTNSSVTVTAGDGLKNGGSVSLGSSVTIDIEPADFAGNGLEDDGSDNLAISTDAIQSDELDQSVAYTFTALQTIQRTPGAGTADFLSLTDGDTSDELRFHLDGSGRFLLQTHDSSAATTRDLYRVDPASQQVDMLATLNFPNVTGTPTFASHDHSEGGMTTIPNAGLTNSSVTVAGNSVSLGGSTAVAVEDLSNAALPNATAAGQLLIRDETAGQFENATLTGGDGISVTNADASITLAADLATSAGLKFSTGQLAIEPADFAGTGLSDDGSDNLQVDNYSSLARLDLNETVSGAWTFNGDVTLGMGSGQNYKIVEGFTDQLDLRAKGANNVSILALSTQTADGTDIARFETWAVGNSGDTDRERMFIGWNSSRSEFELRSAANGTGSVRPVVVGTGSNTNQFIARTDGNVAMANSLKVGGTGTGDGTLHVLTASAGTVSANNTADDLTVENSGDCGITVLSGTSSDGRLMFGDPDDNNAGVIRYEHATNDKMVFRESGADRVALRAGRFGIGELTPSGAKLDVAGDIKLEVGSSTTGTGLIVASNDSTRQKIQRDSSTLREKTVQGVVEIEDARTFLREVDALRYDHHGADRYGFGAEDVDEAGLKRAVVYDEEGLPAGFADFGRPLMALHHRSLQDHETRLDKVERVLREIVEANPEIEGREKAMALLN